MTRRWSGRSPWVTARAVARLEKLARWCVPLLRDHGTLVAMKGRSVPEELATDRPALQHLGLTSARVTEHGVGVLAEPVLTVDLVFDRSAARGGGKGRRTGSSRRSEGEGSARGRTGA